MENTLSNKAKFFALYWGQKVYWFTDSFIRKVDHVVLNTVEESCFLELKPLSSITDEDIEHLINLMGLVRTALENNEWRAFFNTVFIEKGMPATEFHVFQVQTALDFLRSKGYALPWMDLSVEKQIEYGWIKLK